MQHAVLKNEVVVRSVGRSIVDISQQGIHTRQRCILTKCKHIMEYGDESFTDTEEEVQCSSILQGSRESIQQLK